MGAILDYLCDIFSSAINRSRLRLKAACALLKLAQQVNYIDMITLEQYHQVALVMQDSCIEVRDRFTQKLHKGLEALILPPDFMAIYGLAAVDPSKDRKNKVNQIVHIFLYAIKFSKLGWDMLY